MQNSETGISQLCFQKDFLDPKRITETTGFYLTGINSGCGTIRYASNDRFDSSDITSKYGIITGLKAYVIDNDLGKELMQFCIGDSKMKLIQTQSAQIRLPTKLKDLGLDSIPLIYFIDKTLSNNTENVVDYEWNFLTYIQCLDYNKKRHLEQKLQCDMYDIYKDPNVNVSSFDVHSFLTHPHQDSLENCQQVSLHVGNNQVRWADGNFGRDGKIEVIDVIDAIRKCELPGAESMSSVKISFYDHTNRKTCSEKFLNMLQATVLDSNFDFQFRTRWYKVDVDAFLDTNQRFLNTVNKHIYDSDSSSSEEPEILPWYTKENSEKILTFRMDELFKFVTYDAKIDKEKEKAMSILEGTLTSQTSFLWNRGTKLGDETWENNFCRDRSTSDETKMRHHTHVLDLNVSFLSKSDLASNTLQVFKEGKEKETYGSISKIFRTCNSEKEIEEGMSVFLERKEKVAQYQTLQT